MTTDSRPEPPAGSPHRTAPTPVVPPPTAARAHGESVPATPVTADHPHHPHHHRAALASVAVATLGALAAVALAVAQPGPTAGRDGGDQAAVRVDDSSIATPAFALVTHAWSDDDADGLRGGTEAPLAGVVVRLETADAQPARHVDGSVVQAATTGPDGTVVFDDVAADVYRVRWLLPAGYALTTAVAERGRALADSDAEPVDADRAEGLSGPVSLTEGAGLDLPDPVDGVTADRVLRGVDVGATPLAEVLGVTLG
ncbi:SpaA isopeptide-forming pilin-related protein [Cellulomonas fimi]|uniref:SdrD B-like domain-containing protein n=1 Tax=Cellulomonas fimi TaxID=1708 RepID=UPI00234DDC3D|nr:SdrD B-like domain-containing protein [Cellulomonas fimi]MDC7123371.1 SpaA isopeptide-forming pilin-related protein [Cellulomonas fimi]